jgi:hypothetical protein
VLLAIMFQESGFRARALPPRRKILWVLPGLRPSSAYGYSQALDATWQDYRDRTGNPKARRDDFEDTVQFVGWYASEIHRLTSISKDDASNLYLAYHDGPRGYSQGTYQSKTWLQAVARKVGKRAETYQRQFETCEPHLRRSNRFWIWLASSRDRLTLFRSLGRPRAAGKPGAQLGQHLIRHQTRHIGSEAEDFLDEAAREIGILLGWSHENGFEARIQSPIHESHLKLVLKIRHRPQASDDDPGRIRSHEIHQQAREALYPNFHALWNRLANHLDPFFRRKEWCLGVIEENSHDELVANGLAATDDVDMTIVNGIETANPYRSPNPQRPLTSPKLAVPTTIRP